MSNSKVRFGLIGFGAWGNCHANTITKTEGAKLVAIAAKSKTTCQSAHEAFPQSAVFSDYRELLERNDIDLVDIALPSFLHRKVALAALNAGKHLLLEKPMCLSVEQCEEAGFFVPVKSIIALFPLEFTNNCIELNDFDKS